MVQRFREFPGINFNFSQLIRDHVEEALSGVKRANSVKLFGNFPAPLGQGARQDKLMEGSHFTDEILRGQDFERKSSREDRL